MDASSFDSSCCSLMREGKERHFLNKNLHYRSRNQSGSSTHFRSRHSGRNQNRRSRGSWKRKQAIDPRMFVNDAIHPSEQKPFTPVHSFTDFGFDQNIEQILVAHGYTKPTPIQDETISLAMEGRDIIGLANTGTGKTAAFLLPVIHRLLNEASHQKALIISPTRELTNQINEELRLFAKNTFLRSVVCVGGLRINKQISQLSHNPQVIIGTPGRLKDLIKQGKLKLDKIGIFVLDEADRMLDMGFINDIRHIIERLPRSRQSLCFSATTTPSIKQLIEGMMVNPVTVSVITRETSDNVHQSIVRTDSSGDKVQTLHKMLKQPDFIKVLVFSQTKHGAQRLADNLAKSGIKAEAIHGNKSQPQRQRTLNSFKNGNVDVLVATDVAARGLDIPQVSHVINFDQPDNYKDYIHRIGRTGRAGKPGKALTFIN
jgi:superfamily II DNA/RNA helicase